MNTETETPIDDSIIKSIQNESTGFVEWLGQKPTRNSFASFTLALQHNKSVHTLYLEDTQIGFDHVYSQHFAELVRHNTSIRNLWLDSNQFESQSMEHIARALCENSSVLNLQLNTNRIDDQCAQYLAETLQHNSSIRTLLLCNNFIGDRGAQHIAQALCHNSSLIHLGLEGNQISLKGVRHLARALQHNSSLYILFLAWNSIDEMDIPLVVFAWDQALRSNLSLHTLGWDWDHELGWNGTRHLEFTTNFLKQNIHFSFYFFQL